MKRSLTAREWMLLGLLGLIALASSYVMLFYMPVTARRDSAKEETELCRLQMEAAQVRLEEKRRMERELEALFAQEEPPLGLAPYDNVQAVMFELNTILSQTQEYSLSFGTVDTEQSIVRRSISLNFTCGSCKTVTTAVCWTTSPSPWGRRPAIWSRSAVPSYFLNIKLRAEAWAERQHI